MPISPPRFDRDFDPHHDEPVRLSPLVRRLTAKNPGPFTFHGTNTFLVGEDEIAVIDPGPDDPAHVAAILTACEGRRIRAILVTHTHLDHSPAALPLRRATGAPILAEGPHRSARAPAGGEIALLDASADRNFTPDVALGDGETVQGAGWRLEAIATPGHTANHLCFALAEERVIFTGDHVMAWSTSIVAPPDGAMADYMASLDRLSARSESRYHPAHGGPVVEPAAFVAALRRHRLGREAAVLAQLAMGPTTIPAMVAAIYTDTPAVLHAAAALSLFAHVEDLAARGLVTAEGPISPGVRWRRV